jgi:hypothetical protein
MKNEATVKGAKGQAVIMVGGFNFYLSAAVSAELEKMVAAQRKAAK